MLRTFAEKFRNNVFHAPDGVGDGGVENDVLDADGVSDSDAGGDDSGGDGTPEGGEPGEGDGPLSVREEIKRAMAQSSEDANKHQQELNKTKKKVAKPSQGVQQPVPDPQASKTPAPARLTGEAKAEWEKTPVSVQQAFVKAEQDMQRGVDELKNRYALIDKALEPHTDALRQMNATPADAVNRMFLWFKALAGSPQHSFPQLAQSFGFKWSDLVNATMQGQQQQGQAQSVQGQQGQGAPEIPEPVRNYMGQLEGAVQSLMQEVQSLKTGYQGIQQDVEVQNQQKARDNLGIWSKDKPYFEEVRQTMAQFLQAGLIPLKDGQVDLDTAYERAIHYHPEVRAKVLSAQQVANQQVQQASQQQATTVRQGQVTRARKASVSLPASSAPGAAPAANTRVQPGTRKPVRESLREAIQQLRDQ